MKTFWDMVLGPLALFLGGMGALFAFSLAAVAGCAALRTAERAPCPPTELASIDARFAAEAIATCKAEQALSADTCKALPGIRAKYAAERAAWVECK